jgi:hypothetical protein
MGDRETAHTTARERRWNRNRFIVAIPFL